MPAAKVVDVFGVSDSKEWLFTVLEFAVSVFHSKSTSFLTKGFSSYQRG